MLPIPIHQIILTDIAVIKQQLGPYEQWSFRDHHEDITLGTIPARQLLARSRNYLRTRDEYRSRCDAPPKWRYTSPQWASRILFAVVALSSGLFGTNGGMARIDLLLALTDGLYPLCGTSV